MKIKKLQYTMQKQLATESCHKVNCRVDHSDVKRAMICTNISVLEYVSIAVFALIVAILFQHNFGIARTFSEVLTAILYPACKSVLHIQDICFWEISLTWHIVREN